MQITDKITAQNQLFDLAESETEARTADTPRNAFKHVRVVEAPIHMLGHGEVTHMRLTIGTPFGLTLDFEATRPTDNSNRGVECDVKVGVFHNERHKLATKLEDHVFVPDATGSGTVLWQHKDGHGYTSEQLCAFAFARLLEYLKAASSADGLLVHS